MGTPKYQFNRGFQQNIIKIIFTDDKVSTGLLELVQDSYFTSIEDATIIKVLKSYFKKHKHIPDKSVFIEVLKRELKKPDYQNLFQPEDLKKIRARVQKLYKKATSVKGSEEVINSVVRFAQHVELKSVLESVDIHDFSKYESYANAVKTAVNVGAFVQERPGTFIIKDSHPRLLKRKNQKPCYPTPIRQINDLTNGGGYYKGSILVIIDEEKHFKTGALLNIARGYQKMKMKVVYFDFENGEELLSVRFDQSRLNKTREEILNSDEKIRKMDRLFARLGAELAIIRLPTRSTAEDCQAWLDLQKLENGFVPDIAIFDTISLMSDMDKHTDDFGRIAGAYNDVQNLALKNGFIHVWTANHVTRKGADLHRETRYKGTDIALCINIPRHVDALFGLNRTEDESGAGVLRFELVEQRDGKSTGAAYHWIDYERQRLNEFTHKELEAYRKQASQATENKDKEKRDGVKDI